MQAVLGRRIEDDIKFPFYFLAGFDGVKADVPFPTMNEWLNRARDAYPIYQLTTHLLKLSDEELEIVFARRHGTGWRRDAGRHYRANAHYRISRGGKGRLTPPAPPGTASGGDSPLSTLP